MYVCMNVCMNVCMSTQLCGVCVRVRVPDGRMDWRTGGQTDRQEVSHNLYVLFYDIVFMYVKMYEYILLFWFSIVQRVK